MRVLLHGCNGKMGQVMSRVIAETPDVRVVCGVDISPSSSRVPNPSQGTGGYPVYPSLADVASNAPHVWPIDVLIDFSHHSASDALLAFGIEKNVPLLICTTGFSAEEKARMAAASTKIPILHSANMSLGVNLLISLVRQAAALLGDTFDIEIVEKHHNQKADAPSGTAIMIADAINEALEGSKEYVFGRHTGSERRRKAELGIHAVRGGTIVGEHSVIFAGPGEVVEINHTALSRELFAHGALRAARFLVGQQPGLYSMNDVMATQQNGCLAGISSLPQNPPA